MKPSLLVLLAACGSGVHSEPTPSSDGRLRVGDHHACVLHADGTVQCWGRNQYGELGVPAMADTNAAVEAGFTDAIAIAPGHQATCGVKTGGTVWCWGRGIAGDMFQSDPVQLPGEGFADVSLSQGGLCGRKDDGSVWCWADPMTEPTVVIASGAVQATWQCAVMSDGSVQCWGDNTYGQLGDGTYTGAGPVVVQGLSDAVEVATGDNTSCARRRDGSVWCWGENQNAQLGVEPPTTVCAYSNDMWPCRPTAAPVPGLANVDAIALGSDFATASVSGGGVLAWGADGAMQLGRAAGSCGSMFEAACSATPLAVPGQTGTTALAAGDGHACACQADGSVRCWGAESGDGSVPGATCD